MLHAALVVNFFGDEVKVPTVGAPSQVFFVRDVCLYGRPEQNPEVGQTKNIK